MSLNATSEFRAVLPLEDQLTATRRLVRESLSPLTVKIDLEGLYPEGFLRSLGGIDGFRQHLASARPDGVTDMGAAIQTMAAVSHECLSTGFATWCQDTCGWYLQTAAESEVRDTWLPKLATGSVLGGTGMSNTMKAFANIEPLRLKGKRVDGGYVVNGSLPWVSNLGPDHVFGTLFAIEGQPDRSVMALVDCASRASSCACRRTSRRWRAPAP
jgi:alkylation response protein AidB-like acyl-CoA dehydrogenase